MKFNFKKISAIGASILMAGMSLGVAAAAPYPAPFVVGGTADVAIVYGTGEGVLPLDLLEAGNIQSNLQSYMTGTSSATASTSGETVTLDSSSDRIWLNTSLNSVKSTLTKSDLPTVLADYTFEGDVTSKLTSIIKIISGKTTDALVGTEHTGTVIFAKQPKSSNDPIIGISLGTNVTFGLYNASVTMSAINFSSADSEGEEIVLFGQKFTISADTTVTDLVLLKEAQTVSLSTDSPTATVTIGGADYIVELISASDTAATIQITNSAGVSASKEINEADSKKVNGVQVAVKTADETNLKLSASVIVGADKITLINGAPITTGDSAEPVDGTLAYIKGTPEAATEIAITVFAPDTSTDAVLSGTSFVDPVFGSFKVDFAGLSSPLDDANREIITVANSGDDSMSLTMTDSEAHTKTFEFAHNVSRVFFNYKPGNWTLADDSNESIYVYEMANLTEGDFSVVGNEDYGHLVEVTQIYNYTGTDYTKDAVTFKDVFSGETYSSTFTSECATNTDVKLAACGSVSIDGKSYAVVFQGSGDSGWVQLKYPTSDSGNSKTFVLYPTIETKNGGLMALYEPLNISLSDFNKSGTPTTSIVLSFPDGDSYTTATFTWLTESNWSVAGANTSVISLNVSTINCTTLTIGELRYNLSAGGTGISNNYTIIDLVNPEDGLSNLHEPSVVLFEGKDDNTKYDAVVINLKTTPAGSSTNGVGVDDILYSSDYYHSDDLSLPSDSDVTKQIDWWGTLGTMDANDADQKTATLSYPKSQVYANIYLGTIASAVSATPGTTGATQLGEVIYKDSESTYSTKNVIVVGGSCINSAAAKLVGEPACGARFTELTGVTSGQFLIKGYATSTVTSKLALLVAGYNVGDTTNAAKYLRNKLPDTSSAWIGTSSTEATLQTTAA